MTKDVETIVASLKGIIDKNGPGYLEDEPYPVYTDKPKVKKCQDHCLQGASILTFFF